MNAADFSDQELRSAEAQAVAYLKEQLGERAPDYVRFEGAFDERPLEGEGRAALFSFEAEAADDGCQPGPLKHYVAVGRTQPNYFPAYEMGGDDAYSFHVGTRFMLEMAIQRVDDAREPPGARDALRRFVAGYAPGVAIEDERLAALFRCDEAYFAVYRVRLGAEEYYCMGADCPPGFHRLTRFPPQMALRLHLGKVIRAEARQED